MVHTNEAKLHLLCGKAASGKSTLAALLAKEPRTVLISEDAWLAALYGEEMATLQDYATYSSRLERAMAPHVMTLLKSGLSVVLDFQANTVARRAWMKDLIEAAGVPHLLHFLDLPDSLCKERLRARNARADHPFTLTEAQFDRVTQHFVPPGPDEGFTIVHNRPEDLS